MFYEIITIEPICGFEHAYYVQTYSSINSLENKNPIPQKVRLLIEDREEHIIKVNHLLWWKWFYLKHIHHNWIHPMYCFRIDWEKERY